MSRALSTYAPITRRRWPGTHPNLGALLGLILLLILVPYSLDYGVAGLAMSLLVAGLAAGALARGGAAAGFRAGARAAGGFMLILLSAWALLLLQDTGAIDLSSSPEVAEFMPYVILMEGLWERISLTISPLLQNFINVAGGDRFVDLIMRVAATIIPVGIGGAAAGAFTGKPQPRPLPMAFNPQYMPGYAPGYPSGYAPGDAPGYQAPTSSPMAPYPGEDQLAYQCPWCGLKILPHMEKCWNCGGPIQLPPPPAY